MEKKNHTPWDKLESGFHCRGWKNSVVYYNRLLKEECRAFAIKLVRWWITGCCTIQVIFSWTRQTAANHIIVADDLVPNDPIGKMALSLAKPSGCSLDIIPFSELNRQESNVTKEYYDYCKRP